MIRYKDRILKIKKVYLRQNGGIALSGNHFYAPMYRDLTEVLDLFKVHFTALTGRKLDYVRTFESGTFGESEWIPASYVGFEVEEYFVFELTDEARNLIFRVSPALNSHDKTITCTAFTKDAKIKEMISGFMGVCARANQARLVLQSGAQSDES